MRFTLTTGSAATALLAALALAGCNNRDANDRPAASTDTAPTDTGTPVAVVPVPVPVPVVAETVTAPSPTATVVVTAAAMPVPAKKVAVSAAPGPAVPAGPPAAFGQCAACHSVLPGKNGVGPSLFGIYGTKAGDVAGYAFSPALKASGMSWNEATLDKWIAAPMQTVPGTKMVFPGLKDAGQRKAVIAYIRALK